MRGGLIFAGLLKLMAPSLTASVAHISHQENRLEGYRDVTGQSILKKHKLASDDGLNQSCTLPIFCLEATAHLSRRRNSEVKRAATMAGT